MTLSSVYAPFLAFAKAIQNFWLFTSSDLATFVVPNTVFGVCCALAGPPFVNSLPLSSSAILSRIPLIILFNLSNTLIFDLANQRLWESVQEDKLNKPWRPIPSGRMTRSEVRKAMQIAIPAVLAFNHYFLSAGAETACIMVGCWVYNDLKVSDDSLILRNAIASLAFGVFNWSSLKVAIGGHAEYLPKVAEAGSAWIWIYSGVIFTTLHVQDLKDQAGDRVRGRSTAPLVIGDGLTRWTLAVPITLWGPVCAMHCEASLYYAVLVSVLGAYVAWRCLRHREQAQDRWTWQLWCFWTAMLSLLPLS
jgi:hypothetical protein